VLKKNVLETPVSLSSSEFIVVVGGELSSETSDFYADLTRLIAVERFSADKY
jgi:hypothetical protein